MKPPVKTIDTQLSKGQQDYIYTEILSWNSHKLRVSIKSDSYEFQSHAKIARWDGDKWHNVYSIPYSQMSTKHGVYYQDHVRKITVDDFQDDRDKLIIMAKEIVG